MNPEPDAQLEQQLSVEQVQVDRAYARLDADRSSYRARLDDIRRQGPSGSPQNRSERDAFASHYESNLARLNQVENQLVFGRLDLTDASVRYIGRIGLQDENRNNILIDWRAPTARAFYQATAANPGDVVRRRHLMTQWRRVIGIEDELLNSDAIGEMAQTLAGEGALFAALSAKRDGRMSDIVTTIQAEQDAVVRAPLDGVIIVQGGPGTGKTAVALHRVAYLLYTYRERLERSGVLLIGPSHAFLRYIEQVLPSLGESDVVSTTLADLLPGIRARAEEHRAVARAKGVDAWQHVLARAVKSLQRVPEKPQVINVNGTKLTLHPGVVRSAMGRARRSGLPHNQAWETFARAVLDDLVRQYADAQGGQPEEADERAWLYEDVRSHRDVRVAVNLCWLPTSAETMLTRLYAHPEYLKRFARGLTRRERELVAREAGAPWTEADVPLLDELAELLGPLDQEADKRRRAEARERAREVEAAREAIEAQGLGGGMVSAEMLASRVADQGPSLSTADHAAADREWTYGHIVIDEAQELSPMAWRALARRCPARSFTVVGDLAQHSSREVPESWRAAVGSLASTALHEATLTISYRTPGSVLDLAGEVAQANGTRLPHPVRAVRDLPDALRIRPVASDEIAAAVGEEVRDALTELGREHDAAALGRVAVIAAVEDVAWLDAALRATELGALMGEPRDRGGDPLSSRLAVISPLTAKGLEFDEVIVVEPDAVLAHGPGDLYVAMTRPTRRLRIVHSRPLPAGFPN